MDGEQKNPEEWLRMQFPKFLVVKKSNNLLEVLLEDFKKERKLRSRPYQ
jgi:hypothetical protein